MKYDGCLQIRGTSTSTYLWQSIESDIFETILSILIGMLCPTSWYLSNLCQVVAKYKAYGVTLYSLHYIKC